MGKSYDNVIILGAGASCEAGVPVMNDFVDTMWSYSVRGRSPHGAISEEDRKLLGRADEIRVGLERYNSRANFNIRNLEDILSLLSFEALAGGTALEQYQIWVRAITRTIELSTNQPHCDNHQLGFKNRKTNYQLFWRSVLGSEFEHCRPALITFNYDLVLERTLWNYFHCLDSEVKKALPSCKIKYFVKPHDFVVEAKKHTCELPMPGSPNTTMNRSGFRPDFRFNCDADIEIPYLKLHGSLNWCSPIATQSEQVNMDLMPPDFPTRAVQTPLILPPVFNKMNASNVNPVWTKGLEILREAKHIIIVGYSLPKTDIYMQYFLKSAVGPNNHLQWITVFDPTLFRNDAANEEMRSRYQECFSQQFQDRIIFQPKVNKMMVSESERGKFSHFVEILENNRRDIMFIP